MEISGEAIIVGMRKFGEHGAVVRLFSREHGIYAGVCKHALSSKQRGVFQLGNVVQARWHARLEEHLGTLNAELVTPIAALTLQDPHLLLALSSIAALCCQAIEERDPHPTLYDAARALLLDMALGEPWQVSYVRFEWLVLAEAGFGLDVSQCAATGQTDDLVYVSPKSGCAVSREAGLLYHEKLLPLPSFLLHETHGEAVPPAAIVQGLRLTGYFLHHWLLEPHGRALPPERERLVALLDKAQARRVEEAI